MTNEQALYFAKLTTGRNGAKAGRRPGGFRGHRVKRMGANWLRNWVSLQGNTLLEQSVMSLNAEKRDEKLMDLSVSTAINLQRNWVVKCVWRDGLCGYWLSISHINRTDIFLDRHIWQTLRELIIGTYFCSWVKGKWSLIDFQQRCINLISSCHDTGKCLLPNECLVNN